MHGDLMFAGAEKVLRTVARDSDDFSVAILYVTRVDTINDTARAMLAGCGRHPSRRGEEGIPGGLGRRGDPAGFDDVVFNTLDGALAAAGEWLRAQPAQAR